MNILDTIKIFNEKFAVKLTQMGHETYRVSEIKKGENLLGHDFNVINYAKQNNMLLITKDKETGKACKANGFSCIWINDDSIFDKIVLVELAQFKN